MKECASKKPEQVLQCRKGEQQLLSEQSSQLFCVSTPVSMFGEYADKHLSSIQQGIADSSNTLMDNMRDKYFMLQRYRLKCATGLQTVILFNYEEGNILCRPKVFNEPDAEKRDKKTLVEIVTIPT